LNNIDIVNWVTSFSNPTILFWSFWRFGWVLHYKLVFQCILPVWY